MSFCAVQLTCEPPPISPLYNIPYVFILIGRTLRLPLECSLPLPATPCSLSASSATASFLPKTVAMTCQLRGFLLQKFRLRWVLTDTRWKGGWMVDVVDRTAHRRPPGLRNLSICQKRHCQCGSVKEVDRNHPGYLGGPCVGTWVLNHRDLFPTVREAALRAWRWMWAASPSWQGEEIILPEPPERSAVLPMLGF